MTGSTLLAFASRCLLLSITLLVIACSTFAPASPTPLVANTAERRCPDVSVEDGVTQISADLLTPFDVLPNSSAFPTRRIRVDSETQLYVVEMGRGNPIVVLNGGPGNSLETFLPHFSRAASFARVILYDPRGVGQSDWTGADSYSTEQALVDLERLRVALRIERWVVAGHSWGGLLAQLYALRHPERVRGLVLISSAQAMNLEREDDTYLDLLSAEEKARLREIYTRSGARIVPTHSERVSLSMMRELVFNGYVNGDWKRQYYCRPSLLRIAHVAQHEWRHDRDYNQLMRDTSFTRSLLGAFSSAPYATLLAYGAWDMSFSQEMPPRLAQQFPQSQLVIFDHSSHNPFESEPDKFFEVLESFIRGVG